MPARPPSLSPAQLRRALAAKRDGGALPAEAWHAIVAGYVAGEVDDAVMAALAMACATRGMQDAEIAALTRAMVESGEVIRFADAARIVDKHSSGGVGDTVSLIVVPLVAACGIPVAKLAGRALGHTGGTLDKLEAVPGVRTHLDTAAFVRQVERIGCAIAAQSERLVPADKKLYALRDRTATIPSIGLIAASIVSKKIAGGAGAIVFDVKSGRGAFMRTGEEAHALARALVRLAAAFGRRAAALVTDMDEPLPVAIGSGLEAVEARDFLRGTERDGRLAEAVEAVALEMLRVAGTPEAEARERLDRALASGAAYERFERMLAAQGAAHGALDAIAPHPARAAVTAHAEGVVASVDGHTLGEHARELVAADGPFAGIRLVARVGTPIRRGEVLAEVVGPSADTAAVAAAFTIGEEPRTPRPLVHATIRDAETALSSY